MKEEDGKVNDEGGLNEAVELWLEVDEDERETQRAGERVERGS